MEPRKWYYTMIRLSNEAFRVLLAFRQTLWALGRRTRYTLSAVATLSLGIGANVLFFAPIRAVVLTPAPFEQSPRLAFAYQSDNRQRMAWSYPQYRFLVSEARTVDVGARVSFPMMRSSLREARRLTERAGAPAE